MSRQNRQLEHNLNRLCSPLEQLSTIGLQILINHLINFGRNERKEFFEFKNIKPSLNSKGINVFQLYTSDQIHDCCYLLCSIEYINIFESNQPVGGLHRTLKFKLSNKINNDFLYDYRISLDDYVINNNNNNNFKEVMEIMDSTINNNNNNNVKEVIEIVDSPIIINNNNNNNNYESNSPGAEDYILDGTRMDISLFGGYKNNI